MSDPVQGKRGEAAWKEQRDAISQRNADARKRAQVGKKSRDGAAQTKQREHSRREQDQLRELNVRLDKQQRRRGAR